MSTPEELWSAVDAFANEQIVGEDDALRAAATATADAGLPWIAVTPAQGKLLYLLTRLSGTRRVLELGTLGGYSTIWLARALPADGEIVTLELEGELRARSPAATSTTPAWARRSTSGSGRRLSRWSTISERGEGPFDLAFLDADKKTTPDYLRRRAAADAHRRPDDLRQHVRGGEVANPDSDDEGARGMRRYHELLAVEPRVSATTIQTVGDKGYDGFTIALLDTAPPDGA